MNNSIQEMWNEFDSDTVKKRYYTFTNKNWTVDWIEVNWDSVTWFKTEYKPA